MEENVFRLLIFLAIAFVPSALGAISGIGGGILIKPALDALSGLSVGQISFLSGTTVLAMTSVSLLRGALGGARNRGGLKLEAGRGTALALGAALGGLGGKAAFSLAAAGFAPEIVGAIQSLILTILTVIVLIYTFRKNSLIPKNARNLPFCAFLGLCIGLISSFLGIGGGPVNIMAISFFLGMDTKTTALHSLYLVFLSQLASFLLTAISGSVPAVPLSLLAVMIAGGVSGGLLGSRFLKKLRNDQVDVLFRAVLIAVILAAGYNFVKRLL